MNLQNAGISLKHFFNRNAFINAGIHPIELQAAIDFLKGYDRYRVSGQEFDLIEAWVLVHVLYFRTKKMPLTVLESMIEAKYFETLFISHDGDRYDEALDLWDKLFDSSKETPASLTSFYRRSGFKRQFKALV